MVPGMDGMNQHQATRFLSGVLVAVLCSTFATQSSAQSESALVRQWPDLQRACAERSNEPQNCTRRNEAADQLNQLGWCLSPQGSSKSDLGAWQRCETLARAQATSSDARQLAQEWRLFSAWGSKGLVNEKGAIHARDQASALDERLLQLGFCLNRNRAGTEEWGKCTPQSTNATPKWAIYPEPLDLNAGPKELVRQWLRENGRCRGTSGDVLHRITSNHPCDRRGLIDTKLEQLGWCHGRDGQSMSERVWQPCASRSTVAANRTTTASPQMSQQPFEGKWADRVSHCSRRNGDVVSRRESIDGNVEISARRYEAYESSCRIKRSERSGETFKLHMDCESEGEKLASTTTITLKSSDVAVLDGAHKIRCP
jgi:hypothetical protein